MSDWLTAIRFARRDLRGGLKGFRIFVASLALGVAAIAGVGSLSSALVHGLAGQGQAILGGDIELKLIHREASAEERAFLSGNATAISEVANLRAMVKSAKTDKRALVELKAVDGVYPLYGEMSFVDQPDLTLPQALGQTGGWGALVEETLLTRLGIAVGDTITINALDVPVRAVIAYEPDRVADGVAIGPRVMITQGALSETGLVQLGSLIHHAYRLKVPVGHDLGALAEDIKTTFPEAGWRINTRDNSAPGIRAFVARTATFLTLVGLTALVVGGVGVGNAVRSWLDRQRDTIATLKCLGADGRFVFRVYLMEVVLIAAIGIAIGLVLGAAIPIAAAQSLSAILPIPADVSIYPAPLALAAVFGLLTALLFALWPLAQARDIPAAHLFRALVSPAQSWPHPRYMLLALGLLGGIVGLALATSESVELAGLFIAAIVGAFVVLRLSAWGVEALARRSGGARSVLLRLAISNLHRPGAPTGSVVLSLGLGLTVLSAVALIEGNLNRQITERLPQDAPSFFFVDIQSTQVAEFDALVDAVPGTADLARVPSLRGRIIEIDGVRADQVQVDPDAQWALRGDRGLTYAKSPPPNSTVVDGEWWPEDYSGPPLISFDAELARGMGIGVGDTLTYNVLGRNVTGTIANLRLIEWTGMGINFTTVFAPGLLEAAPHTHLATVRVTPDSEEALFKAVTDDFPNVTAVRVRDAIKAANDLLGSLGVAVRATGAVTLLGGILVLAGAIAAGHRARVYDSVMLKVLGATRSDIVIAYLVEYALLGLATALIAAVMGSVISFGVITFVMQADWLFLPATLAATLFGAVGFTIVFGLFATAHALQTRPAPVLRTA